MAIPTLAHFKLPVIENEPMRNYGAGSEERAKLLKAIDELKRDMKEGKIEVPLVINGKEVRTESIGEQKSPYEHESIVCKYYKADAEQTKAAIKGALDARNKWEALPFNDRIAVFLKAADLLATKYRYKAMAATMVGQGKNIWQAEIDAAAELCDFWRFNCKYAEEIYSQQPPKNAPNTWNRVEFRALEGFTLAVSPFNFTAIGGNLPSAPAVMGNVALWKPSDSAVYSNYLVYKILVEAGLPAGVIQFIPGAPEVVCKTAIDHPEFSALHFTGSTYVFRELWKQIGNNIGNYKSYPRIVGETGGKNFHLLHPNLDKDGVEHAARQTIRGAFEYQGQKCSACSRVYVPSGLYDSFKKHLLEEHQKISGRAKALEAGEKEYHQYLKFSGPVIHEGSFNKIKYYIDFAAADDKHTIIAGGKYDGSVGYFVEPTIIETTDWESIVLKDEIFGPVVAIYKYQDDQFDETCKLIGKTTQYALTGALFANDRHDIAHGSNLLRATAGNFYINDKCTGAVVGQQPFGGGSASGTNDKAGSWALLNRFVSIRTIKENFVPIEDIFYPSNYIACDKN